MSTHNKRHLIAFVFVLASIGVITLVSWIGLVWWAAGLVFLAVGVLYKVGLAFADGAMAGSKSRAAAKVERAKDELHRELTVEDKATMLFPGDDELSRRCRHAYQMGAFDAKTYQR